jgi:hypothetical protein
LTPYHGTEARRSIAAWQAKEKDDDQDRKREARPRPQASGRLPLRSLHLPELRLLMTGRAVPTAARAVFRRHAWHDRSLTEISLG